MRCQRVAGLLVADLLGEPKCARGVAAAAEIVCWYAEDEITEAGILNRNKGTLGAPSLRLSPANPKRNGTGSGRRRHHERVVIASEPRRRCGDDAPYAIAKMSREAWPTKRFAANGLFLSVV
jgi:hypothetical protein